MVKTEFWWFMLAGLFSCQTAVVTSTGKFPMFVYPCIIHKFSVESSK